MLDKTAEYHKMAEAETVFWWYRALHYRILHEIIRNFGQNKDIRILDSGCGTGGLMLFLRNKGYTNITGFDLSDLALDFCEQLKLNVSKQDIFNYADIHEDSLYDVIVNSDVLCYIEWERHTKIIPDLQKMLKSGGLLLVNLPAFNIFKGEHDIAVGLLRRYNIKMVRGFFPTARIYCWPFLLSPVILISRLLQKVRLVLKLAHGNSSDVKTPIFLINNIFYGLCKFEINHLRFRNWGSSIFVTIKKA